MPPSTIPSLKSVQSNLIAFTSVTSLLVIIAWLCVLWVNIPENTNLFTLFLAGCSIYAPYTTVVFALMYYLRWRQLKRGAYRPLLTRGAAQMIVSLPPLLAGAVGLIAAISLLVVALEGGTGSEFVFIAGIVIAAFALLPLILGLVLLIVSVLTLRKSRKEKALQQATTRSPL